MSSFKNISLKGVKWSSITTLFNTILTPLFNITLALLLAPAEFAYIAVIVLILRIAPTITRFGLEEAFIQRESITKSQASSLIIFTAILSVFVSIIIYFSGGIMDSYYKLPSLEKIIKILAIAVFFEGIETIFKASLKKHFYFKELAIISMVKMIMKVTISIILILLGYEILGYVIGTLIAMIFSSIAMITVSSYLEIIKFKIYFSYKEINTFLSFGFPVTGRNFLTYLSQKIDEIIIGGTMSTEVLGVYFFGKNMMMQVRTVFNQSFSPVLLSLFAKVANDNNKLKNIYLKLFYSISLVAIPSLIGIALTADLFIPVIFGDQWIDSVIVFQILAIAFLFQLITENVATNILYTVNKPYLVLYISIGTSVFYLVILYMLYYFNLHGLVNYLLAFLIYSIVLALVLQNVVNKYINIKIINLLFYIRKIVFSVIVMVITLLILKNIILNELSPVYQLIIVVLTGATIYVVLQGTIDKKNSKKLITLIKSR